MKQKLTVNLVSGASLNVYAIWVNESVFSYRVEEQSVTIQIPASQVAGVIYNTEEEAAA